MSNETKRKVPSQPDLDGRRVILGVTGSIAAYKAVELLRELTKAGACVDVIMTESAQRFIRPLTFTALNKRPVISSMWTEIAGASHIELAVAADLLIIAPATAAMIAHCALGISDDMLSAVFLATRAPVLIAPAMNSGMLENPATQANIRMLRDRGVLIIDPEIGDLACGEGQGRLAGIETIMDVCRQTLRRKTILSGRKIIVTAGPTREPLDDVRFISNRSSGQMGFAIAEESAKCGAEVTLLSGPVALETPYGVDRVSFETAEQLREELSRRFAQADAVVMAAAIADFRPVRKASGKIRKDEAARSLGLEATPDILGELGKGKRAGLLIGFALEEDDLEDKAVRKMKDKNLDMIIANDISAMESADSRMVMIKRDGSRQELKRKPKRENAIAIVEAIAGILNESEGG